MEQVRLKGDILFEDGWSEGSILLEGSTIMDLSSSIGTDLNADRTVEGLIIPGLLDMHTHLGDHGARGDLPASLEKTVFPGGIKHEYLETSSNEELVSSIRSSIKEVHPGVTFLLDYREGGIQGLADLETASSIGGPHICPLARYEMGEDLTKLLNNSCGIGHPSLSSDPSEARESARTMSKLFSIHASELYREDVKRILAIGPDQVVHMISGESSDWVSLANADIPVVVCPRSNQAFGLHTPMQSMLDAGLSLSLGTDNSLSMKQDMFREMEAAWLLLRSKGISGSQASRSVFDMAIGRTLKDNAIWDLLPSWTKWWEANWPRKNDPSHLFVLERPRGDLWKKDPFSQIVRFTDRSSVIFTPEFI